MERENDITFHFDEFESSDSRLKLCEFESKSAFDQQVNTMVNHYLFTHALPFPFFPLTGPPSAYLRDQHLSRK